MSESKSAEKAKKLFENEKVRKIIVISGIIGIALIFISSYVDFGSFTDSSKNEFSVDSYSQQIENDLSSAISKIEGAGKTKVMLTMENSKELVYIDGTTTKTKEIQPLIRGVLVLCEGGDDPTVVERITQAVTKTLGISSAKVCIAKLSEIKVGSIMKFQKKYVVLSALVLALAAAVYVNWQFSGTDSSVTSKELGAASYVSATAASSTADEAVQTSGDYKGAGKFLCNRTHKTPEHTG